MASAATPGSQQDFVVNVGDRVFFESDQTDLSPQAIATLEKQAQWLQTYNRYAFTIEGHADERGTREYNIALGARRAQSVRTFLASRGIDAEPDADDLLRQGAPGRGLQRHLLLVAEPPRGHGAERQLLSVRGPSKVSSPAPSGAGFVLGRMNPRSATARRPLLVLQSQFLAYSRLSKPVTILAYSALNVFGFRCRQGKMSSRFHSSYRRRGDRRDAGVLRMLAAFAQLRAIRRCRSGNADPAAGEPAAAAHRPERGAAISQPAARRAPEAASGRRAGRARRPPAAAAARAAAAAAGPAYPGRRQPQAQPAIGSRSRATTQPQIAAPAPIVQEPPAPQAARAAAAAMPSIPSQNPNAPGAPRALGGGQLPIARAAGRRARRPRRRRAARSRQHRRALSAGASRAATARSRRQRGG